MMRFDKTSGGVSVGKAFLDGIERGLSARKGRCLYCDHRIWFWQSRGWEGRRFWHRACWAECYG
jgi:hypothetical protein